MQGHGDSRNRSQVAEWSVPSYSRSVPARWPRPPHAPGGRTVTPAGSPPGQQAHRDGGDSLAAAVVAAELARRQAEALAMARSKLGGGDGDPNLPPPGPA